MSDKGWSGPASPFCLDPLIHMQKHGMQILRHMIENPLWRVHNTMLLSNVYMCAMVYFVRKRLEPSSPCGHLGDRKDIAFSDCLASYCYIVLGSGYGSAWGYFLVNLKFLPTIHHSTCPIKFKYIHHHRLL